MRVNDGSEVEGSRRCERLCSIDLKSVIVRGGEKGGGIERVEGQMGDAEFMGGSGSAGSSHWLAGVSIERVFSAFEIPE